MYVLLQLTWTMQDAQRRAVALSLSLYLLFTVFSSFSVSYICVYSCTEQGTGLIVHSVNIRDNTLLNFSRTFLDYMTADSD